MHLRRLFAACLQGVIAVTHKTVLLWVGLFGLGVVVGALLLSAWRLPGVSTWALSLMTPEPTPALEETSAPVRLPAFEISQAQQALVRSLILHTDRPERPRFQIMKYTIKQDDTPWSIAEKFGLTIESILWGNEGMSANAGGLQVGQEINILPENGVMHTVQEDDTWEKIEYLHGVALQEIAAYPGNHFPEEPPYDLVPGQKLIIPGGRNPIVWQDPGPQVIPGKGRQSPGFYSGPLIGTGMGFYIWPVQPIRITQPYWSGHPAIDVDTYTGQPVFAADSGTVIFSGMSEAGYGNLVIIDHGTGYWTYYAHNDVNYVSAGQAVLQGQQIAESGNTGNSTGDHLDFRIRVAGGAFIDPTPLLPPAP